MKGVLSSIVFTRILSVLVASMVLVTPSISQAAVTKSDILSTWNQTTFYDPEYAVVCTSTSTSSTNTGTANTNIDYAGNKIFNDAQLSAISKNTPTYQQAADQVNIPWQMIAVIHIRETGGSRENPSNGQGVYQFVSKQGGPYPTGPIDDVEFLRQTILAAEFIKNKASSNYTGNTVLTTSSGVEVIKDTFFGYNGRAAVYEEQATQLGYSENEGYEGSPYVMNKADAVRDPNTAADGTWGQIKQDFGVIEYPANQGYGAFVMYAALSGISMSGNCASTQGGPVRGRVVALARQELALWDSGQLTGNGTDFYKYSYGSDGNWCAWFVSWLFYQAGYSVNTTAKNGVEAAVINLEAAATKDGRFIWHDADAYTPSPGDIAVQLNGKSHTVLVVSVDGDNITVIGGNQGYGDGATSFKNSRVSEYTYKGSSGDGTTGYLSPAQ